MLFRSCDQEVELAPDQDPDPVQELYHHLFLTPDLDQASDQDLDQDQDTDPDLDQDPDLYLMRLVLIARS